MSDEGIADAPARGFISYRRADNDEFGGVVDELAKSLKGVFEARTGRRLELFVDRESIGWGEDWRQSIEVSVRRATFFFPIITMRYFTSQACVDELTAFEATARQLGVTDLILPIVLFGGDVISEEDDRPEVQMISRLNYRSLEAAWEAGYQSPEWRKFVNDRAKELATYMSAAEASLATLEAKSASRQVAEEAGENLPETEFDVFELNERVETIGIAIDAVTELLDQLSQSASALDSAAMEGLSPSQVNARLLSAAHEMTAPAKSLEAAGKEAESSIRELDPLLRQFMAELSSLNIPSAIAQRQAFADALSKVQDLGGAQAQINELTQMIQFVSLMSVGFRKALRPAVNGLRSMQTAMRMYEAWRELAA